jgi:integrase
VRHLEIFGCRRYHLAVFSQKKRAGRGSNTTGPGIGNEVPTRTKRKPEGVDVRHEKRCATPSGSTSCTCHPSYSGWVWDKHAGKKIRGPSTKVLSEAKAWRQDALRALRRGELRAREPLSLRQVAQEWMRRAEAGEVRTRSGKPYKPSALRGYRQSLERHVLPVLGDIRIDQLRRQDVQHLVDRFVGEGMAGSSVRKHICPLQTVCRRALRDDLISLNPTHDLDLPSPSEPRERAASPEEAADLLAAAQEADRALWATAFYAGLRRGELQALRWSDLDEELRTIHVQRGWDPIVGAIDPKSKKGDRLVPVAQVLRHYLLEHKARTGRRGDDLVFGRTETDPFSPALVRRRALRAWEAANKERKKQQLPPLVPISMHECRHTFVSLMHAAGRSLEEIGDYVGHSSAYMTDRYRHLIEGQREQAAAALDKLVQRTSAVT